MRNFQFYFSSNLDLDMEGLSKFEKFKMSKVNQSPISKKERRSVMNATTHIGELFDDILDAYIPESSPVRSSQSQVIRRQYSSFIDTYSMLPRCHLILRENQLNFVKAYHKEKQISFFHSNLPRNDPLKARVHSVFRK